MYAIWSDCLAGLLPGKFDSSQDAIKRADYLYSQSTRMHYYRVFELTTMHEIYKTEEVCNARNV
jgi:hypothetical protein